MRYIWLTTADRNIRNINKKIVSILRAPLQWHVSFD